MFKNTPEKAARKKAKIEAFLKHKAERDAYSLKMKPVFEEAARQYQLQAREAIYKEKQSDEAFVERYKTINPNVVPAKGYSLNPKKISKKRLRRLQEGRNRKLTLSHLFSPEALVMLSAASGVWSWTSSNTAVATVAKTGTDTATSSTAIATGVKAGTTTITATLSGTDSEGKAFTTSGTATLTVNAAPASKAKLTSITSITYPNGINCIAGTAFDSGVPVVVCDDVDDGSYTYKWASYSMSGIGGLSVDASTGRVTGTPSQAGTGQLSCTVTDSYKNSQIKYVTFTATASSSKVALQSVSVSVNNTTATVGTFYTGQITPTLNPTNATGVTTTYQLNSDGAAAGLSVNSSTGAISGTPSAAGSYYATCTSIDDSGNTRHPSSPVTITVNSAPTGISLSGDTSIIHAGNQSTYSTHGKPYSRNWWVTIANSSGGNVTDDGTLTYLWYWIDNTTGTGLVFDPDNEANIMIDGTPTKAGQAHMQCDITDIYGTTITAPAQGISIS